MYQCKKCGGNVRFDIEEQMLKCDYCNELLDPYGVEKEVDASKESVIRRIETAQKLRELEELQKVVENIPKEILDTYKAKENLRKDNKIAYE